MTEFENKVAFVTGSSRGIGKAVVLELAKHKVTIVLNASSRTEEAKKTLLQIRKYSPLSSLMIADISNYKACQVTSQKIKKKYTKVDILINNAGIVRDKTFAKMSRDEWKDVIDVNLNGVFNVTSSILPLIPQEGRIINISSIIGIKGGFGQSNYAASKAGLIGLTKSLSLELAYKKITVNAVAPGYTDTDMFATIPKQVIENKILPNVPLGRLAKPEEIAKTVIFLAGTDSQYITGQVIGISGGIIL